MLKGFCNQTAGHDVCFIAPGTSDKPFGFGHACCDERVDILSIAFVNDTVEIIGDRFCGTGVFSMMMTSLFSAISSRAIRDPRSPAPKIAIFIE